MPSIDLPFDLPPSDALEFFRSKGYQVGFAWQDVWREAHARSFTVAKAMSVDILADIRGALDKALAQGRTFEQFRDELEPLLRAKGWWGRKEMMDPLTGEVKDAWLGTPWRLRTIFDSNLQSAYGAGRYRQMAEVAALRPFWMYDAVNDSRTRPEHRAWDGIILPHDHPWWDTHYPPNGWRCRCSVSSLSRAEMESRGLGVSPDPAEDLYEWQDPRTGQTSMVPRGVDPGWDHNPGKEWMGGMDRVLADKLDAAPADLAHATLKDMAASPAFREFLDEPRGFWPVMRLARPIADALASDMSVAVLSAESARKNKENHPDLDQEEYGLLPLMGESPDLVVADGPTTAVVVRRHGRLYWAAVKATATRHGLLVTSFRRTPPKDIKALLQRGRKLFGDF